MPVHPCGRYHRNSVLYRLQHELAKDWAKPESGGKLHPCHRLDRGTSGLLLLATNAELKSNIAAILERRLASEVEKTYLALVHGIVEEDSFEVNFPLCVEDYKTGRMRCVTDPDLIQEIQRFEEQRGPAKRTRTSFSSVQEKRDWMRKYTQGSRDRSDIENAKPSQTFFSVLHRDSNRCATLLSCTPYTGRTHQIRVHLSTLGYPIINDRLYGHPTQKFLSCHSLVETSATAQLMNGTFTDTESTHCTRCDEDIQLVDNDYTSFICLHSWKYCLRLVSGSVQLEAPSPWWADLKKSTSE